MHPDDREYVAATVAHKKKCGTNGGFVAGSDMHYDHGYDGGDEW